jgi:hypothetical protein
MRLDRFVRRVYALQARLPTVKNDMKEFLEKCTVQELRQLRKIIERGGEPTPEESSFLEDLETKYGPI